MNLQILCVLILFMFASGSANLEKKIATNKSVCIDIQESLLEYEPNYLQLFYNYLVRVVTGSYAMNKDNVCLHWLRIMKLNNENTNCQR